MERTSQATPEQSVLRLGIIGLGGYAGAHHEAARALERTGCLRLVATCDPAADRFTERMAAWDFAGRGVRVFPDLRALLDGTTAELDWVVIPTPIPLHAEMHRACVERGLAVYLEKPPTLDPSELEMMINRDRSAPKATNVGFNFIIQPARRALKARLLAGEFGELQEIHVHGIAGRPASYFQRNGWAGKLFSPDGRPLLDSCLGNAMAHSAHNALFWAGTRALQDWAAPQEVRARLFRAHKIEGPDTVFVECLTVNGVRLRLAMTHASPPGDDQWEDLVCSQARIRFVGVSHYEIYWRNGRIERREQPAFSTVAENQRAYCEYLRGRASYPATTLAESRPFVHLNALMYLSARCVEDFPSGMVRTLGTGEEGGMFFSVDGLPTAMERFLVTGDWPDWSRHMGPAVAKPDDLPRLVETLRSPAFFRNVPAGDGLLGLRDDCS